MFKYSELKHLSNYIKKINIEIVSSGERMRSRLSWNIIKLEKR